MADELAFEPAIAETNTDVVDADAESTEAKPESAPGGEKPTEPVRDKVQERFDKLTREKYDALRRADQLEYRLSQLEERAAAQAKPQTVAPSLPTLESVGYDEAKYAQALIEYAKTTVASEAKSTFERERAERAAAERATSFDAKVSEFAKTKADYYEKVMSPSLPITQAMAEVIRESDLGPQVAYYLADNPEKALAIARLSPTAAAREIGRIEARLEADVKPKVQAVSKAPPPPAKLEAEDDQRDVKPDEPEADKLSDDEWMKRRNKQVRRKGN